MGDNTELFDPTEVQLRALQGQEGFIFKPEELANSTGITLLLQQRYVDLNELKSLKRELEKLRIENHELIASREELRIEIAKLQERGQISLAEIIVGGLFGYGLSIITTNLQSSIVLLIVSVALLLIMKNAQIWSAIQNLSRKDRQNATR